jgi:hypothetical protein
MLNVSAWVKLTANSADNRLFTFGDGTNSYIDLTFNDGTVTPGIRLKYRPSGGTEKTLVTPTQLPLNVWKHITVTMTLAGAAIYVDGKVAAKDPTLIIDPSTLGTTAGGVVGNSPAGTNAFQGTIDEFYVYDGGLTRTEILALAAPKTDYSIFHFEEGTGTTTEDSSDRNKDGVLVGGAAWAPGILGNAVKLTNGTTGPAAQYVKLADGLIQDCALNLTVAAWVKLETNNYQASVFEVGPDDTALIRLGTAYKPGMSPDLTFQMNWNSTSWATLRAVNAWTLGQWYHIAAVRTSNGSTAQVYLDGAPLTPAVASWGGTRSFADWGATTRNYFGKSNDYYPYPGFNGTIDEILISCRVYTDGEIAQLAYKP